MAKGKKAVEITETVLRDAHQSLIVHFGIIYILLAYYLC